MGYKKSNAAFLEGCKESRQSTRGEDHARAFVDGVLAYGNYAD